MAGGYTVALGSLSGAITLPPRYGRQLAFVALPQRAKPVAKETKEPESEVATAPAPRREITEADMNHFKMTTKAALDAQPKREVRLVVRGKGEPNYETVCINGYLLQIQRGVAVEVPQVVYEILAEANLI